jgi:hypothetical protein
MLDYQNGTASPCYCDEVLKSGLQKAKTNPDFDFNPAKCALVNTVAATTTTTMTTVDNTAQLGCKANCPSENAFTLDTAADWLGLHKPCACAMGDKAGQVVANYSSCPEDLALIGQCPSTNLPRECGSKGRRVLQRVDGMHGWGTVV